MAAIRNVTKETVINSFAFCGIKPDMATVAPVLPQVNYLEFEDAYNPEDFEEGEEVEVEEPSNDQEWSCLNFHFWTTLANEQRQN